MNGGMHITTSHFSPQRIYAMVLRHVYLMRKSWPRLLELAYWPSVQMILWGFIAKFFAAHSPWVAQAPGLLIAAVLLWDVLFRSQLGVSLTFFEEMYSRNLGHLFVSPLRPYELVFSKLVISLLRTLIGVGAAALLAIPLYHYSIFGMGLALLAFFANLMIMGWAIGLMVSALVLRYGLGAETFAWAAIFAAAPVSGVYYPVSVLPEWLQPVAWLLPSSHVFEGMRAVLIEETFLSGLLARAVALNALYISVGIVTFLAAFHSARKRGLLLHIGE
jgi:ABC-2 type transport system permease protein